MTNTSSSLAAAAYKKLSIRSFHSDELRQALKEKGYPEEEIFTLIKKLEEQGYLNDSEWVESFSRKCVHKMWGKSEILQKLKNKRVRQSDIEKVLANTSDQEIEVIQALIAKKYASKDLSDYETRKKVINALYRKGFSLDNVYQAIPVEI